MNPRNTEHVWDTLREFFVQSIKETYPESDTEGFEAALQSANPAHFSRNNVDNVSIVLYLLGMVDGLL